MARRLTTKSTTSLARRMANGDALSTRAGVNRSTATSTVKSWGASSSGERLGVCTRDDVAVTRLGSVRGGWKWRGRDASHRRPRRRSVEVEEGKESEGEREGAKES
jgi:hypothetical protein